MRTIFTTFLLSFLVLSVYGQTRKNREKLSFQDKSDVMSIAIGWSYNSVLGEWVDYENVISVNKEYKTKSKFMYGTFMKSLTSQNFINMITKTIIYNEQKYYVLVVEKWDYYYEYPNLKMDRYCYKNTFGYIFTESEYNKLKDFNKEVQLKTNIVVSIGSKNEKYNEQKFLDYILTEITREISEYSTIYTFPVLKSDEENIRFYLPDRFSEYSEYNFDKEYFETTSKNFNKIIFLKSP